MDNLLMSKNVAVHLKLGLNKYNDASLLSEIEAALYILHAGYTRASSSLGNIGSRVS